MSKRPRKLRLDDLRWLPLDQAHERRRQQTGDRHLAARDLTDALADGRLRCMARRIGEGTGPDRELVPPAFWADWRLDSWADALLVRLRGRGLVRRHRGSAFFIWETDLKKIFGAERDAASPTAREQKKPERRGRPREHDWPEIAAELASRVITMPTWSNEDIVVDLLKWCQRQNKKEPPRSELSAYVSALRRRFPRSRK